MTTDPRIEPMAIAIHAALHPEVAERFRWKLVHPEKQAEVLRAATAAVAAIDKAATITTVEGLAKLPQDTVIIDKHGDVNQLRGEFWCGHECSPLRTRIMGKYLPARVIHWGTE